MTASSSARAGRLRGRVVAAAMVGALFSVVGLVDIAVRPGYAADPTPVDTPTDTAAPTPTDTEPPPPPPPPDPILGVKIDAGDLSLDSTYWQGNGGSGAIPIAVKNTGDHTESITISYSLPPGVRETVPCACTNTVDAGAAWMATIRVSVDPEAWRRAPLSGTAAAVASIASRPDLAPVRDQDGFSIILPPGPPTPGVSLNASDLVLPVQPARKPEVVGLSVRLANTGQIGRAHV